MFDTKYIVMPKMVIEYYILSDDPDQKKYTLTVTERKTGEFDVELAYGNTKGGSFTWFTAYDKEGALKPFVEWVHEQEELRNEYHVTVKGEL